MGNHIENKSCPVCSKTGKGSSLSVYDDGIYCNECGYRENEGSAIFKKGAIIPILSRGLTKESLGKYNVQCVDFTGHLNKMTYVYEEPCVIFNFYDNGRITKQKIRSLNDKTKCTQVGNTKSTRLFGQQAFTPTKKVPVIITEGEFDAVAVYQAMGYPAVSMGSCTSIKYLKENLDWLSGFSHVVLCFDSDISGITATDTALSLFEPGTVRIAHLPLKDANDMIKAGREEELKKCIWNAEIRRPSTIVTVKDIIKNVKKKPTFGIPWLYKSMNKVTYGLMPGDMYTLAAAEGVGKTEFIKEIIFDLINKDVHIGLFSFEQDPSSTIQRFVGGEINKKLHLHMSDDDWWDEEEIEKIAMKWDDKLFLYNNLGTLPIDVILLNIRYLVKAHDVKFIVLDNLSAMCATPIINDKVVRDIDYITHVASKIDSICKELKISALLVGHLSNDTLQKQVYVSTSPKNPDAYMNLDSDDIDELINKPGMTWESGRMPSSNHIFGGGMLRKLSSYVIVLSRNSISPDLEEARTTKVKFLKTRLDSTHTGLIFKLKYDFDTGRLEEVDCGSGVSDIL